MNTPTEGWKERFDEEFVIYHGEGGTRSVEKHLKHEEIESFISTEIERAKKEGAEKAITFIEKEVGLEATTHFIELCEKARNHTRT